MVSTFKGWGAKPEASKPVPGRSDAPGRTAPRSATGPHTAPPAPRRAPERTAPRRAPGPHTAPPAPRRVPERTAPRRAPRPYTAPLAEPHPVPTRRAPAPHSRPAHTAPVPRSTPAPSLLSMPMSAPLNRSLSTSPSGVVNFEGTTMPPVMPSPSRFLEPTSTLMEKNVSTEVQESQIADSRRKASATESGGSVDSAETSRRERSSSRPRDCPFRIGQIVNVRNSNTEQWTLGEVKEVDPLVKVSVTGNAPVLFSQLAPAATREFYTCEDRTAVSLEFQGFAIRTSLVKDTAVQIVEFRENWAHIVSPVEGWIIGRKNGIKVIKSAKVWKKEQEEMKKLIPVNPVPTIIIDGVPERCTSAGLATKCIEMRLPAMPTRIRILGKGTDRKAVVEFDNTDSANHCYKVWCRSVTMRTSWDQGYLLYKKENAI